MQTAACRSSITYLDGNAGILRYRGYPIEQLAEQSTYLEVAYLLLARRAPEQGRARAVDVRRHPPHLHPREHAQAVRRRVPLRRPPDGHVRGGGGGARDVLQRLQGDPRRGEPAQADPAADRQDPDDRRHVPPLLGRASLQLPQQRALVPGQLPADDVEDRRRLRARPGARAGDGRAVHPPRRPRAELRHHGDAGGRVEPGRPVLVGGSSGRAPCTARCTAAPTRPSCGCWRRSVRSRTSRPSSTRSRAAPTA